jgi:tetratricopeptide (TPR) repeat protein
MSGHGAEPEADEAEEGLAQAAPAALAAALGRRRQLSGEDPKLDAFLDEQTRLLRLQAEHLHEQRELQLEHLRVRRWKDRLSLGLQALGVVVGAALVIIVGAMAWQAHEDHGLVIDAFSVPPDLARDGLTGEVAAGRFLDKLQAMQTATAGSDRPEQSYENNWGSQLKVEIPDTGLTVSEFEKLLREKLGHVTHVTGEVVRTQGGIALTARYGTTPPQTFSGPQADFDALAQQSAEAVYRASQPYRYTEYLQESGRWDEAFKAVSDLAENGPASERGWAYAQWAIMDLNDHGDSAAARLHAGRGVGFGAGSDLSDHISLVNTEVWSGHEEADLAISVKLYAEVQKRLPDTSQVFYLDNKLLGKAWLEFIQPDYRSAAASWLLTAERAPTSNFAVIGPAMAATAYALDHDPAAARQAMASPKVRDEASYMWNVAKGAFTALPVYWTAAEAGDWPAALADAQVVDKWLEANKAQRPIYGLLQSVWIHPLEALALAKTGDVAGAQALIGTTPLDCYLCLRVRGLVAAEARDWPSAERWFAEAVRQAPSSPFAYTEWGEMLLAKGDLAEAIGKFEAAHARGPRWADPLELWGEALMRRGDRAGAAAKFREAVQDAPHWDRARQMLAGAGGHG